MYRTGPARMFSLNVTGLLYCTCTCTCTWSVCRKSVHSECYLTTLLYLYLYLYLYVVGVQEVRSLWMSPDYSTVLVIVLVRGRCAGNPFTLNVTGLHYCTCTCTWSVCRKSVHSECYRTTLLYLYLYLSIEKRTEYGHLRQQFYPLTHPLIINLCG